MIDIPTEANQVFNIVKARHNLKTKSEAITKVALEYGLHLLEPDLKPSYLKKLAALSDEKGVRFKNMAELKRLLRV